MPRPRGGGVFSLQREFDVAVSHVAGELHGRIYRHVSDCELRRWQPDRLLRSGRIRTRHAPANFSFHWAGSQPDHRNSDVGGIHRHISRHSQRSQSHRYRRDGHHQQRRPFALDEHDVLELNAHGEQHDRHLQCGFRGRCCGVHSAQHVLRKYRVSDALTAGVESQEDESRGGTITLTNGHSLDALLRAQRVFVVFGWR
jgi:hypothetical protein